VKIVEARLVYNHKARRYDWHVVCEEGQEKPQPPGDNTVAVDLGEIHPAAVCDQDQAIVVSARALRASHRRRNDALSALAAKQATCVKRSRRWCRLQRSKHKVRRHAERRIRDINHKVSRAVVDFAFARKAGTVVIGDVRDIADGIDKGKTHNRRTSNWTHGQLRQYITYKAASLGMETVLQDERYTSQTCPCCGNRRKQSGRVYTCRQCAWVGNRDGQVGAANLLSAHLFGSLARVQVKHIAYRHPYSTGKRTLADTQHVANGVAPKGAPLASSLEAAGL
jgi:putative transposase